MLSYDALQHTSRHVSLGYQLSFKLFVHTFNHMHQHIVFLPYDTLQFHIHISLQITLIHDYSQSFSRNPQRNNHFSFYHDNRASLLLYSFINFY